MAITFSKDISVSKLLMAYNNNVVRFSSNNVLKPLYCSITGIGINALIYPHPNNSFYFNFIDYISAIINTKNFADDLVTTLVNSNASSFTYDVSSGTYVEGTITFKITFSDLTFETITRFLHFITGVNQIEDYKKQEIPLASTFAILSPVENRSNNTVNLKYWEGYPFEFSFYTTSPAGTFTVKNNSNGLSQNFTSKGNITSLYLSDGLTDITLGDLLPLATGMNNINILLAGVNQNLNINLNKVNADCGIYIKWLNRFGRYNYWLLNPIYKKERYSKYGSEMDNDFSNLEDTTSPTLQFGKTSSDTLKCNVKKLSETEKNILIGLFDSPKIYLFTGEIFSKALINDWIEITLKNTNFEVENSNQRTFKFNLDLELPTRYAQSL